MSDFEQSQLVAVAPATPPVQQLASPPGRWKAILTLLVLAPAIGELLSGSSTPQQFFNPLSFLLLVGLYGCGALLVRELVALRELTQPGHFADKRLKRAEGDF